MQTAHGARRLGCRLNRESGSLSLRERVGVSADARWPVRTGPHPRPRCSESRLREPVAWSAAVSAAPRSGARNAAETAALHAAVRPMPPFSSPWVRRSPTKGCPGNPPEAGRHAARRPPWRSPQHRRHWRKSRQQHPAPPMAKAVGPHLAEPPQAHHHPSFVQPVAFSGRCHTTRSAAGADQGYSLPGAANASPHPRPGEPSGARNP